LPEDTTLGAPLPGWRDAAMIQRWVAAAFLATEKSFCSIMDWKNPWQLKAILVREEQSATKQKVA